MPFPWNFPRQTIKPYLTDWKNDSKQSDEIKANWNKATDSENQCKRILWQWKNICDTKPTQLLREVGRKTEAYVFLSGAPNEDIVQNHLT